MKLFTAKYLYLLLFTLMIVGTKAQLNTSMPNSNSTRFSSRDVSYYRPGATDVLLDSAQILASQQPLRAIDKINKAIELSIASSDRKTEGYAYLVLGTLQQKLGQHEMAIDNFKKCINTLNTQQRQNVSKIVKSRDALSDARIYKATQQTAVSQTELKKYDEAEKNIRQCLDELPGSNGQEQGESGRILADILFRQGKMDESRKQYEDVLKFEKENSNAEGQIKTLIGLGKLFQARKDLSKASEMFGEAKSISEKNSKQNLLVQCNDLLADVFRQQKDVEKEVAMRNGNIILNNTNGDAVSNVRQNYEIGNAYVNTNQLEKAIPYYQKTYGETDKTVFGNLNTNSGNGLALDQSSEALKILTTEYLKKGEKEKALEYFNKYSLLQDSIRQMRKNELEQALSIGTSLGKNQQRIDLLEKERQLNVKSIDFLQKDKSLKEEQLGARNLIIGALAFCIVFLLIGGIFISKNASEKRKANQLLAIKSLRGQMNPHFIFNALNSVNHYISRNDERSANKYLSDFSKLMRSVMESSKHDFIPLAEETETLKLYLELEHARFSDKFDYTFEVNANLPLQEFEVPPMIIQPYIENAVWHGLRYIEGKGKLDVRFSGKDGELLVTVKDNGIGRKKSAEIKTKNQKSQKSEGTQNIENRIAIMNKLYGLNIRVNMSDAFPSEANCGTSVEILIPKKK